MKYKADDYGRYGCDKQCEQGVPAVETRFLIVLRCWDKAEESREVERYNSKNSSQLNNNLKCLASKLNGSLDT